MIQKYNIPLQNTFLFRCIFFFLLFLIPMIQFLVSDLIDIQFSPLFFISAIFLGIGFWDKSKLFLIFFSTVISFLRLYFIDSYTFNLPNLILIELVCLIVTFVSVYLTKNYIESLGIKLDVIKSLANILDSKDPYTANHSQNVAKYAVMIANEMNLSKSVCDIVYIGGLLHDIGKVGIPEQVLFKTGRLTSEEYDLIKNHPTIGYETLKHISFFKENGILDMILYHHERYDGKGYPNSLKGEEIPLLARIMSIADSFDAMTSKRVYRDQLEFGMVINEISTNKESQFDPKIADVFLRILQKEGMNILINPLEQNLHNAYKAQV